MPSSAANSSTRPAALRARSRVIGLETLKLSRMSSASCFVTARYFRVSTGVVLTKQCPAIGHAARSLALPYHGSPAREYSPKVLLTHLTHAAAGAHRGEGPRHREARLVVQRDEAVLVGVPVDPSRDDVDTVDLLGPDHGRGLLQGQQAHAQVPHIALYLRARAACVQTHLLLQAAMADSKDLGVALRAGGIDDQQVVALYRAAEQLLRDKHLARLAQQIAQPGGALELEVIRGVAQFGVHAGQQLVARAAQEVTHLPHHRVVLLGADAAVARPQAAPQRVAQARGAVVCARGPPRGAEPAGARADGEQALHQVDHRPDGPARAVRPEVARAVGGDLARAIDAGKRVLHVDLDEGVVFIGALLDVEAWLVALDQLVLQDERLQLRADHDRLQGAHGFEQPVGLAAVAQRLRVIGGDPRAQVLGLPDVDDCAALILHQVDAGRGRQVLSQPGVKEHAADPRGGHVGGTGPVLPLR